LSSFFDSETFSQLFSIFFVFFSTFFRYFFIASRISVRKSALFGTPRFLVILLQRKVRFFPCEMPLVDHIIDFFLEAKSLTKYQKSRQKSAKFVVELSPRKVQNAWVLNNKYIYSRTSIWDLKQQGTSDSAIEWQSVESKLPCMLACTKTAKDLCHRTAILGSFSCAHCIIYASIYTYIHATGDRICQCHVPYKAPGPGSLLRIYLRRHLMCSIIKVFYNLCTMP